MVVCDLEFRAMTKLIGEGPARELLENMAQNRPYPWIYSRLLDDPRIREVNERHGMVGPGG